MFQRVIISVALLAGSFTLQAQIDTRLKTNTDLLDVYKTTPAKPEVLTVFDFSNSMYAMFFHPKYYVSVTGDNHVGSNGWYTTAPQGDNTQFMAPLLDTSGKVYFAQGWGINGYIPTNSDGKFYWPQRMDNTGTGRLVKPNGELVPISGTYNQAGLTDLVKQASHIRMTATYGSDTRTVDLPIPWAIFDRVTGTTPTIQSIADTIGGGPAIIPDEAYQSVNPNNIVNGDKYDYDKGKYFYKIGLFHYNADYLWWIFFGKDIRNAAGTGTTATTDYVVPAVTTPTAAVPWTNDIPAVTRTQALKQAVVTTWLKNQKKVWWGYRYLDPDEQNKTTVSPDNGSASSTSVSRDIRLFRKAQNSSTADPKLKQFVQIVPSTGTPLTYAFANGYAQLALNKDAGSTFGKSSGGGQSGTEDPIPPCRGSFLVVFTDGVANDTRTSSTSAIGTGSDVYAQGDAAAGNTALGALSTALTPGTAGRFNIWTLAAVAAHYASPTYSSPTGTGDYAVGTVAPFFISDRGATTSNKRRIRTMTVGLGLYGNLSDAAGGKSSMYRAALYGNPKNTSWVNPTSTDPTPPFDPTNASHDRDVNPFFYDTQNPSQLTAAMESIIDEAVAASGSVSAPSAPLVGLSLGREAFLGLFEPAKKGPLWKGDLLAAGLKISTTSDTFLGNDGAAVTNVNSENAIWSAGDLLQSQGLTYNFEATQVTDPTTLTGTGLRSWKLDKRKVITNVTGKTLIDLDETTISNAATVGATTEAERVAFLRFLRGAHASAETGTASAAPSINRITILGDVISSSPAVVEYPLDLKASSPVLSSINTTDWKEMHFRVI
ncbi:MAG: hypothetical protein Q8O00_15095, partial [Holophaga sp.]|nr:hypothetical protein [Holophaga sp.]